jgi:hypothetical protein
MKFSLERKGSWKLTFDGRIVAWGFTSEQADDIAVYLETPPPKLPGRGNYEYFALYQTGKKFGSSASDSYVVDHLRRYEFVKGPNGDHLQLATGKEKLSDVLVLSEYHNVGLAFYSTQAVDFLRELDEDTIAQGKNVGRNGFRLSDVVKLTLNVVAATDESLRASLNVTNEYDEIEVYDHTMFAFKKTVEGSK